MQSPKNLIALNCPGFWDSLSVQEKLGALVDLELFDDTTCQRISDEVLRFRVSRDNGAKRLRGQSRHLSVPAPVPPSVGTKFRRPKEIVQMDRKPSRKAQPR